MDEIIRTIVVEDLDVLRLHFCNILKNTQGIALVGQASSGKQALQLVKEQPVDVVLMDIEMDFKHDGIITAKTLISEHSNIKIVFLTIHEDDETVFKAFETGAVDYVLKSSPSKEIISSIRSAYYGKSPIRPEIAFKIRNEFSRIKKNEASIIEVMNTIAQLTPSQREIIALLLKGMKLSEVANIRCVEESTIKSQVNDILKKFNKKRTKEVISIINELKLSQVFFS